jgi:hypothetical protein
MGPANVAPWLEQVGDGLAKKVTVGCGAEIFEVADCVRDGHHQAISVFDLPLPEPPPKGAQWIAAYRHWAGGL